MLVDGAQGTGDALGSSVYRKFTAQQKSELVLAPSRGQKTIAEFCREVAATWKDHDDEPTPAA